MALSYYAACKISLSSRDIIKKNLTMKVVALKETRARLLFGNYIFAAAILCSVIYAPPLSFSPSVFLSYPLHNAPRCLRVPVMCLKYCTTLVGWDGYESIAINTKGMENQYFYPFIHVNHSHSCHPREERTRRKYGGKKKKEESP